MTETRADLAAMLDQMLAASVPVLLEVTERLEEENERLRQALIMIRDSKAGHVSKWARGVARAALEEP